MPKEQPCKNEHGPCATSSKKAKEKSNSTTLLAMRDGKGADNPSGRGSHCSSEKDSGYSDGSDWQQTDAEDQHSNKSPSRGSECAKTSQPGRNQELGPRDHGNLTSPIYILKNIVLQQSDTIQKRGQLLWQTSSPAVPQVVLCQQPSLVPTSLQCHKTSSPKSSVTGKKMKATYLPIFNSYPRIAPHPSKKPPDKSSSNGESQNLSKRVCTEHKNDNTPVTKCLSEQHLYKQPISASAVSASGQPCSFSTRGSPSSTSSNSISSSIQGSASVTNVCTIPPSFLSSRGVNINGTTSNRHRRFLNTVKILRQSGLLDITLRTKELLQQSNATERDIAQLRQHTELLFQAANNPSYGPNGMAAWECLHKAMSESSSYPNLKLLESFQILSHPDSAGPPKSTGSGDVARPPAADVPQSRLLATLLDSTQNFPASQRSETEQSRKLDAGEETSEKVTFIPPDSSTG
ncbi:CLOCK-interacting pacemaker-like [Echeneis naucrates]|uniref:CLOCK-interacting pacemaker-like n=1 Tax=Echeneis naucrates TaxID=173247 RepID=A0A665V371_ECHNA|nr:CLOCK-interacting pacemaker-like [Echeneis naucrates]XP_029373369.1 CLOCK-interacting pacemaker-like [Echeneis naucrates]